MPIAYTPGLRVTADTLIRQLRRLPMPGEVLVGKGDSVSSESVIARAQIPGNLHTIRAAEMLRVEPRELASHLVKRPGEPVARDEVIAQTQGLWGLFKAQVRAPISGALEEISEVSGYVRLREPPRGVEVRAHIAGRVVDTIAGEGAVIEARGALIQGIFGVGGERRGTLRMATSRPDQVLDAGAVGECDGCVLVAGAGADYEAIHRAAEGGARGMVVGGVTDEAVRRHVGYDIGVAITGQEDVSMALIVTEGFGDLAMANRTWELLASLEGRLAAINGATQIRAGVIRPEIVVTHDRTTSEAPEHSPEQALDIGSRVRLIREPYFGALGKIAALPPELTLIATESRVRVAQVTLDDGSTVTVPRANLELIQG